MVGIRSFPSGARGKLAVVLGSFPVFGTLAKNQRLAPLRASKRMPRPLFENRGWGRLQRFHKMRNSRFRTWGKPINFYVGGFIFLFIPIFGEMIQFDDRILFADGWGKTKPPPRIIEGFLWDDGG